MGANRRRRDPGVPGREWPRLLPALRRRRMATGNKPRGTRGSSFKLGFGYLALFLLVLVVVAGSFSTHLWVRFEGVRLGYATSKARDERARLLLERRELRLELASLKGPARVEEEAREKLGMEVPEHERIIPMGKTPTSLVASGGAR